MECFFPSFSVGMSFVCVTSEASSLSLSLFVRMERRHVSWWKAKCVPCASSFPCVYVCVCALSLSLSLSLCDDVEAITTALSFTESSRTS